MLSAIGFSAMAAEGSQVITYASDDLETWGKGKSEIYDVAIRIEDPALVGKKITAIRALLGTSEGLESTSLWLSKELTLEKVGSVKVTVPDTYSAEVTPEPVTVPGIDSPCGQLSVALDAPYEITADGIYVGYSLTVPAVEKGGSLSDGQKNPVVVSPSDNPLSMYIRASKDYLKWIPFNDRINAAAAIYVTVEGQFDEYSVGLRDVAGAYTELSKDFIVKATVSNAGIAEVTSLDYTYTVAGTAHEGKVVLDTPLSPSITAVYTVELPLDGIDEYGDFDVDLTVTKVNGMTNENVSPSASCTVKVLPFVPVHRPMLEEFTGLWCGWCTRGYWAMEKLNEIYGDAVVLAAYHNGDPMQVTDSYPLDVDGFPSSTLNRQGTIDPYYGYPEREFGMKDNVQASIDDAVLADIVVEAAYVDQDQTKIAVSATTTFLEEMHDAGYKVGFLLICNGLSKPNWIQSNYFPNYASTYAGTDLEVLTKWPAKVTGLVFNDVVVDVDGMKGVEGSVPADIAFNSPYSTDFEYDIAENALIQDKDNVYVAAFIINPDGSILNSNKAKVTGANALPRIDAAAEEVSAQYFSISGMRVDAPRQGVFVKVAVMSDGSVRTEKIIR